MRGAAQGTTRVESRYTIQTCDPSVSRTAVRWGPQFFFERPAKIPRSFLRSFSLWARHPAETSAELNVRLGAAEFFPGASRQVRRVRKRRRGGNARAAQGTASGRESYTIQTCDPAVSRNAFRWGPRFSSRGPPTSPAPSFDHFRSEERRVGKEGRSRRS